MTAHRRIRLALTYTHIEFLGEHAQAAVLALHFLLGNRTKCLVCRVFRFYVLLCPWIGRVFGVSSLDVKGKSPPGAKSCSTGNTAVALPTGYRLCLVSENLSCPPDRRVLLASSLVVCVRRSLWPIQIFHVVTGNEGCQCVAGVQRSSQGKSSFRQFGRPLHFQK